MITRTHRIVLLFPALALGLASALTAAAAPTTDWPDWRGPKTDRGGGETPLVTSFDPESGTNVLWKNAEAGASPRR